MPGCSLDSRVLIGMIFTDLRHLCILLSREGGTMITLGMDPHPGSLSVVKTSLKYSGQSFGTRSRCLVPERASGCYKVKLCSL